MGNTFGKIFRVTSFGESHGIAVGCVVDGCPAKLPLSEEDIQQELDKRRPGASPTTTSRDEKDRVKILSGVFEGKTLGTPIAMIILNENAQSEDYENLKNIFRPGHADYTYEKKYGFRDYRGGGRSSGRETAARVMAGAIAKKILHKKGIEVFAKAIQIGNAKGKEMEKAILNIAATGDSLGGIIEIIATGVPAGLGEPVFDKLSADLAKALISIPAIKGIEFGSGFAAAGKKGSEQNDPMTMKNGKIKFLKNDAGGILGGISNGENIIIRIAVKPTSSIAKKQKTVSLDGKNVDLQINGRHDPCIVPRLIPVAESMVAIVLTDHSLRNRINLSY